MVTLPVKVCAACVVLSVPMRMCWPLRLARRNSTPLALVADDTVLRLPLPDAL
ncbi:Uncharacterised protein [Bordetella pertussis]|nr:Uncharacterised protein [Bordetella pertussis]